MIARDRLKILSKPLIERTKSILKILLCTYITCMYVFTCVLLLGYQAELS